MTQLYFFLANDPKTEEENTAAVLPVPKADRKEMKAANPEEVMKTEITTTLTTTTILTQTEQTEQMETTKKPIINRIFEIIEINHLK